MANLTLRTIEGRPLTNLEIDNNFNNINSEVGVVYNTVNSIISGAVTISNVSIDGGYISGSANIAVGNLTVYDTITTNSLTGNLDSQIANVFGTPNVRYSANSVLTFNDSNVIFNSSNTGMVLSRSTATYRGSLIGSPSANSNITIDTFDGDFSVIDRPQGNVTLDFINVPVYAWVTTHTVWLRQNASISATMVPSFTVNGTSANVYWENGLIPDPQPGAIEIYTLRMFRVFSDSNSQIFASVSLYDAP